MQHSGPGNYWNDIRDQDIGELVEILCGKAVTGPLYSCTASHWLLTTLCSNSTQSCPKYREYKSAATAVLWKALN